MLSSFPHHIFETYVCLFSKHTCAFINKCLCANIWMRASDIGPVPSHSQLNNFTSTYGTHDLERNVNMWNQCMRIYGPYFVQQQWNLDIFRNQIKHQGLYQPGENTLVYTGKPRGQKSNEVLLDDGWSESEKGVFQAALRMVVVQDSRWIVGEFYMSYGRIWCEKVRLIKKRIFGKGHQMTRVLQPQRERGRGEREREREREWKGGE